MKHNHQDCDHELKFCKQCNLVYCGKCDKEWKEQMFVGSGTFSVQNGTWPYYNNSYSVTDCNTTPGVGPTPAQTQSYTTGHSH